jgi:hypothetical protein
MLTSICVVRLIERVAAYTTADFAGAMADQLLARMQSAGKQGSSASKGGLGLATGSGGAGAGAGAGAGKQVEDAGSGAHCFRTSSV